MEGRVQSIRILSLIYNDILREGVRVFIETEAHQELIHCLKSLDQAAGILSSALVDLALIDLNLPDHSSLEAIRCVRGVNAEAWIVGLTTYEWDEGIEDALLAGASAVVVKHEISTTILDWLNGRHLIKLSRVPEKRKPTWRTYLRGFLDHGDRRRFR